MDWNLLSLLMKIGVGLKNLRFALFFQGADYSVAEATSTNALTLDEEFAQSEKVTYEDKKDYYKKGDRFYKKPSLKQIKQQESEEEKQFMTEGDKWFHSLTHPNFDTGYKWIDTTLNYIVGGLSRNGLVAFMNVAFSPGFGYAVTLLASIALFFSPIGPAAATTALIISLGTIAFSVYRKVDMSMKLDQVKEERVILDEMGKIQKEIDGLIANAPKEFSDKLKAQSGSNKEKLKYTHAEGAEFVLTEQGMVIAVNATLSIATLNPIALLVTFFGMATGYAGMGVMRREYQERYYHLVNHNNDVKASLGLGIDTERQGENNQGLANKLSEMRQCRDALKSMEAGEKAFTAENYQTALQDTPRVPLKTQEHSLFKSFENFFDTSFSWAANNRQFTPFIRSTNDVKKFSDETHKAFVEKVKVKEPNVHRAPAVKKAAIINVEPKAPIEPAPQVQPAAERTGSDNGRHL